jgi:hypothetical protein
MKVRYINPCLQDTFYHRDRISHVKAWGNKINAKGQSKPFKRMGCMNLDEIKCANGLIINPYLRKL